ncbi:MAG: ABC transporter substrate-binding protein [Bryobacterales bacterium]|jgi:iron complex transport system substrate-binding protein|nr:ABC transporter substrate-binding protein [Bryobacterales bacterium]
MTGRAFTKAGRAPFTLLFATAVVLTLMALLTPTAGIVRATRQDVDGPPPFQRPSAQWPRTFNDLDGDAVVLSRPPRRVVSQFWSIDEFLYSLLPPEQIAGVSATAYLPGVSNVHDAVVRHRPVVSSDPERVVAANPELVLVSSSARADMTAVLRSTGIPVYRLSTTFTSLRQIADTILHVGYLTGADAQAERAHQQFLDTLEKARASRPPHIPPPRVLGLGGTFSYGRNTVFHDVVTTVGAINVAAEGGLVGYSAVSTEQILRWDPEWILLAAEQGKEEQVRSRVLNDPAIALTQAVRQGRVVVLDARVYMPMSPYTRRFLEALPSVLYGQ